MTELAFFALGVIIGGAVLWSWLSLIGAEHAEAWGDRLREWDGSDEEVVFTPDPQFFDQDEVGRPAPNVRIRRSL
jgi:hypothetical protein